MAVLRNHAPLDGVLTGHERLKVYRERPSISVHLRCPLIFVLSTAAQHVELGEQGFDRRVEPNRYLLDRKSVV